MVDKGLSACAAREGASALLRPESGMELAQAGACGDDLVACGAVDARVVAGAGASAGSPRDGDPGLRGTRRRSPRDVRWYVARVREGSETSCAHDVAHLAADLVEDCFAPRVRLLQKRQGTWTEVERLLYPGYVFALTGEPRRLDRRLASAASVQASLVGRHRAGYVPLASQEQAWFEAVLDEGRVMRPSEGIIEAGELRVRSGPLRGFESRVRKIDRHKATAWVEVEMPEGRALLKAALAVTSRT